MRCIRYWDDLTHYGILPLRDETHGTLRYIVCWATAAGQTTLGRALGVARLPLLQHGSRIRPSKMYVGSIMLAPRLLPTIGIYALLDYGCREVWLTKDGRLFGIEEIDTVSEIEDFFNHHGRSLVRSYNYDGTMGVGNQRLASDWIH